jgi:hypothetical protein
LVDLATPISHVIEEEPTKTQFDAIIEQLARLTFEVELAKNSGPPPGPAIAAIPPQLVFAQQRVNTESPPQLLTVLNVGPSTAKDISVSILDNNNNPNTDFKVTEPDPFPTELVSQATLAVSVAFAPTRTGGADRTAVLRIAYKDATGTAGTPLPITLKGTVQQGS